MHGERQQFKQAHLVHSSSPPPRRLDPSLGNKRVEYKRGIDKSNVCHYYNINREAYTW
jgi:hypothetical protein